MIGISLNNPSEEFTLGIHCQVGQMYEADPETKEVDFSKEPKNIYRLIFGFLIFSITIYW